MGRRPLTREQIVARRPARSHLEPLRMVERGKSGVLWECRCSCGRVTVQKGSKVAHGGVMSCGCLPRGGRQHRSERGQQVAALRAEGLSYKQVAARLGISKQRVSQLIQRERRGNGEGK
jgi:Homeodomain-like domain